MEKTGLKSVFILFKRMQYQYQKPSILKHLPIVGGRIGSFIPFQEYWRDVKRKKSRSGLETVPPIPFHTTLAHTTPVRQIIYLDIFV